MPPLLSIDLHNGIPAYRQLMDQVKLQVATGVLAAGEEMPSTRALSVQLALNPMTISKAYGLLEREGVLERRRGQTLVVREVKGGESLELRLDPLRKQLSQAAALTHQLAVAPDEALRLFQKILQENQP